MNKDFIPHEQSIELKQLGFDDECVGYYSPDMDGKYYLFTSSTDNTNRMEKYNPNVCRAPLYQQAFRWFRENHGLVALFEIGTKDFSYDIYNIKENVSELGISSLYYNSTYEKAELTCLNRLIEIIKNK